MRKRKPAQPTPSLLDTVTKNEAPSNPAADKKELEEFFASVTTEPPKNSVPDPNEVATRFQEVSPGLFTRQSPPPTPPTKLSDVDRLRAENLSLKLANIGAQFERLALERTRLSREFDKLIQECKEKYFVDITTTRIDEEGNFLGALPPAGPPRATKAL